MRFIDIMHFRPPNTPAAARFPLVVIALAAAAALLWTVAPDGAAAKSTKRAVLGKSKFNPTPNCGRAGLGRDCKAEGKVTAYQSIAQGTGNRSYFVPFKRGKLVSWSITLSRPLAKSITVGSDTYNAESPLFNHLLGSPAKARVAVLRRVQKNKKGPPRWKMVRQSPTQILNPYFGKTVHFALAKPLNVIKGQVIALTIPTWAPAFFSPWACSPAKYGGLNNPVACNRAKQRNAYRGSRGPDKCVLGYNQKTQTPNEALAKSRPHQKVDAVKRYGCYYRGSRLLYTATVVAK